MRIVFSVLHILCGIYISCCLPQANLHNFIENKEKLWNPEEGEIVTNNNKDACSSKPCLHDGQCFVDDNYIDGYFCKCRKDYKGVKCQQLQCSISLLKYASRRCRRKRQTDHKKRQKAFSLITAGQFIRRNRFTSVLIPQMLVHSYKSFIKEASTNPFTIEWYMKMQDTINANSNAHAHFTLLDKKFHNQPTLKDLSTIFEYFYKQHRTKSAMSVLKQNPSVEANFFKDRAFVDQRFAGANVWQIYKVTSRKDGRGLDWELLQSKLNKHFDWNAAVNGILGTQNERAIDMAVDANKLFVAWYPELEDVALNNVQLIDKRLINQTTIKFTAPITMFIMKDNGDSQDLETVAIQVDAIPEARVFVPADGKQWFFAKSLVQRADFNVLQIVHKRLKSHLFMEPICLLMERIFSEFHPIYDMLQYHCRATLETNKLHQMKFYGPTGPLYNLLSVDYSTSVEIINKNFKDLTMDNVDLASDMKKRGLDEENIVPYYPYRDDGKLISECIKSFVNGFVDLYYVTESDLREDEELQQWADLLSVEGNQTALSRGMVKRFPQKFENKQSLKDVLSKLLWLSTGYHASVTFPQLEYAGFLPNAPYRLFADDENNDIFSNLMFGNKNKALDQIEFTSNIASSHLDKLFDYGSKLQDEKARNFVKNFVATDLVMVTKKMAFANAIRVKSAHLPYPYLLPDFITNSVGT
ncbi:arachidonate 5-lipoxygenase-like isoform X2 [Dendronephthya gigantea]|uniref:arachidonate 5-lipoxygenase-like isoform X2 n=1 Tax=Dendronephthya gigantea TaxID=151771 RepID=UPI00106B121B|nr:arachidonate 5-lipoxygenase-like isoform X2 [Dendronephthya gigantea]